jgi:excisionase family DNA binding protein
MAKGKNVLTTGDVAKLCNVAPRTVSKWFDSGQLKGYRIPGSKDRRIPVEELIRFMRMHNMPTTGLTTGKTRILLVDNDKNAAHELADYLLTAGEYDIRAVYSTFETGSVTQKFCPHVLVVSLLSRDIDATGICNAIRSDQDLSTIKIIAVANHLSDHECQALLQKGFDDYVVDMSSPLELVRKIEQAVAIIY